MLFIFPALSAPMLPMPTNPLLRLTQPVASGQPVDRIRYRTRCEYRKEAMLPVNAMTDLAPLACRTAIIALALLPALLVTLALLPALAFLAFTRSGKESIPAYIDQLRTWTDVILTQSRNHA
ncbi:hypothetical protein ACSNOI_35490 [Actinomadura kijaniata]|uniref:hypothetical protein n=1 Tax=Actinomadura kijaniata TaxID=46161 RepID=UPI003F1A7857